jgi:hypothetical protein
MKLNEGHEGGVSPGNQSDLAFSLQNLQLALAEGMKAADHDYQHHAQTISDPKLVMETITDKEHPDHKCMLTTAQIAMNAIYWLYHVTKNHKMCLFIKPEAKLTKDEKQALMNLTGQAPVEPTKPTVEVVKPKPKVKVNIGSKRPFIAKEITINLAECRN